MQEHRRRRERQGSAARSISLKGGAGAASIALSLFLRDAHWHRFVVGLQTGRPRARHPRQRRYGSSTKEGESRVSDQAIH